MGRNPVDVFQALSKRAIQDDIHKWVHDSRSINKQYTDEGIQERTLKLVYRSSGSKLHCGWCV
jgi:hypothetical protein